MINPRIRLPFKLSDVYGGFAEVQGILSTEPDAIVLQFQVKDSVIGLVKSPPKELKIPFSEIESVEYKRNIFVSRFFIRVHSLSVLDGFPDNKDGEVRLKIKRTHKETARNAASHLSLQLSEYRLAELESYE
jgi:hypothetical protein